MALTNTWIGYVQRTYQQIKTQVLQNMAARVPEITDHTEGDIFVKMVGIWGGMVEMLGYYVDNAAREAHISSCRLYPSAVKLAKIVDYRVKSKIAATADLLFTIDAPAPSTITIPIGTEVTTDDGIRFFTTAVGTITIGNTTVTIPAEQAVVVTGAALGLSDGSIDQEILIPTPAVDNSATVLVNALAWTQKDTFGYSVTTSEHYVQTVNEDKESIVKFGDGINGLVPNAGDVLTANYKETEGDLGNVAEDTIINIVGSITLPVGVNEITCTNPSRAAGGSDVESLAQLKRRIPLATRTLMRAVTFQDYIDVTEIAAGVARAGVVFDCGKIVEVYIVPDGGGLASGSLISNTQAWMNERKMLTTRVTIKAAGEVRLELNIDVRVLPQHTNSVVSAAVIANLVAFVSYVEQVIGGTVQLSDIYQVVEGTTGVQYSQINIMTPVPYARPLYSTVAILNWSKIIQALSTTTVKWDIVMTSSTTFQLLKNNSFVGNFTVGVLVVQTEIQFTILAGTYAANDRWEFYTYPYFGTLVLQEPSIPVSLAGDITINATGGL